MKKESFLLYESYKEAIDLMTDEQAGQLIKAIYAFQAGETIGEMDPALQFIFTIIANRLEKDNLAYAEKCKKNAKIAQKREAEKNTNVHESTGGEVNSTNVNERARTLTNVHESTGGEVNSTNVNERARTLTNVHERDLYDSDNDNDSDSDNDKTIKSTSYSPDYQQIVEAFNVTCQLLPKVRSLSKERKNKIKARLANFSEADLQTAFEKINNSDFAKSANWCSFDWIIKSDSNLTKILEGNYDNKNSPPVARSGTFNSFEEFQKVALGGKA